MVRSARETANRMLEAWSKYKLKEWVIMSIAGIIFVTGYVLGTLNWRKGAARIFVILDITLGTAGFFYFCYKGLQIFAEAHDEILAAIYSTQVQVERGESNDATDNNYVEAQTVLGHLQLPKIQNDNSFVDDPGIEDNSYMEFYPYRGSTLALEQTTSKVRPIEEMVQTSKSVPNVYLKPSHLKIDGINRCSSHASQGQSSNVVNFNNSENVYGNISSGIYSNYIEPSRGCRQSRGHHGHRSSTEIVNCKCQCLTKHANVGICECRSGRYCHSCKMQATMSETMLLNTKDDPMQYYQVPKTIPIYSHLTESPDPNRHLKPQPSKRKPLPTAPSDTKHLVCSNQIVSFKPGLEESPLPSSNRVTSKVRTVDQESDPLTRPGLEPSPRINFCSPGNDVNITVREINAEFRQTDDGIQNESNDEAQVQKPEQSPDISTIVQGNEHDHTAVDDEKPDNINLREQHYSESNAPETVAASKDRDAESKSTTPLTTSYQENDSSNEGQDISMSESLLGQCTSPSYFCLQDDVRHSEDDISEYRPGLEPSPKPYQGDGIRHYLQGENLHYADQSFQSPPNHPPRVDTPLPTSEPPQDQFVFPQRGHTLLQHRLSMPINYHLFVPGSFSSQSQSPYFTQTNVNSSFTPVRRYVSHPVTSNSRPPSRYLPPAKRSSSSSSTSSSPPKSSGAPAPRKRPTPPSRGRNSPPKQSSRSPPMIPRKTKSPR